MKKLLIFDLDGTLLDTLEDLKNGINFILRSFGFPEKTKDEIESGVGNGFRYLVRTSLPCDCNEETVEKVMITARAYYQEHYHDETRPYDGILPMLQYLKTEGYPMAILSNKPDPMVKCLQKIYFEDTIPYAVGEIVGIPRKPAPDALYAAMEHFSYNKENSVYIGDSEVDILTAKNAQIPCISVTWGFRRQAELEAAGAECLCHTPEELYNKIKSL